MKLLHYILSKKFSFIIIGVLLFFFVMSAVPVFAQEATNEDCRLGIDAGCTVGESDDIIGNGLKAFGEWVAGSFIGGMDVIIFKPIAEVLHALALMIGGLFIGIGGLTLDLSIGYLVIGMGSFFKGGFGQGVIEMWEIVRDILNIFFIFGFIYIGIKTILSSDDSSTRRTLGYLIVAALFINFSLYITSAIVDFSNIAATQVYNQIIHGAVNAGGVTQGGLIPNAPGGALSKGSIAGAFLSASNMTTFFGGSGLLVQLGTFQILAYSLFMMIFFIFTGFIFLLAAIRLIYRFIALTLYMIFSPLFFLGWILPRFESNSKKWWGGFLKNAFYAPAFLFLIYISLLLMERLKTQLLKAPGDYTNLFKGGAMSVDEFTIFMFFAMMIGFIYASVKVGDMMSVAGAKSSLKIAGSLYSHTVGRGISKMGDAALAGLDRAAVNGNVGAKLLHGIGATEGARSVIKTVGGYTGGGKSFVDSKKTVEQRDERVLKAKQKDSRKAQVKTIKNSITDGTLSTATPTQKTTMERSLRDASSAQLLEIVEGDGGEEMILKASGQLSTSQLKALVESDKLTDTFKDNLKKERARQILTKIGTDFGKANKADLTAIGPDKLMESDIAVKLSEKQIEGLDFVDGDKDTIKAKRKESLINIVVNGMTIGGLTKADIGKRSPDDIADLPKDVFADAQFTQGLSIATLEKIYHKHDKTTQASMRIKLQQSASNQANANPREKALYDFLNNDRIGKNFGK